VDVTGTLSTAGLTSSENIEITGANRTLTSSNINTSNLVVSGPVDVTGTLSTAGLTSSENITVNGSDKTLTVSNVETSNLVVSNRLSGGTISVSNIEATSNLVVGGPADITGTLSVGDTITTSSNVKITGGYVQIKYA
jgi:predicted acyltransferase (DUF342 family)